MASSHPSRPPTNGTTHSSSSAGAASSNVVHRKPSLSSFPSRTPSTQSLRSGPPPHLPRNRKGNNSQSSIQTSSSGRSHPQLSQQNILHGAYQGQTNGYGGLGNYTPGGRKRMLRSQYPLDAPDRHVEYILVASFDIDKGPVMEHQYPGPITGDEGMLAELMMPDQAHRRSEDWTVFFLHKDTTEEEMEREERRTRRREKREAREKERAENGGEAGQEGEGYGGDGEDWESESSSEEEEGGEGPPLIYVLNLVNMKHDKTVRRGAVVKAMAICTRHPFLHIYKPLLLLALEEYFKQPIIPTLERLYDAVNSMDLSLMPRLSLLEKHILMASDNKDLFKEKFDMMIQQRMAEETANGESPSRQAYQLPRDTHEYETRVMYNAIPIPIKVPTAVFPETVGDFSLIKLITTFSTPHSTSPQPFALHPHLTTNGAFTHPVLVLVNAVLTQKRIVFLGHERPSGEVAEAVLAACALVSGSFLRGFTRHAFPYTDLTKIDDLLNVPGFIAGVTNPTFANHPEWWDLLCDIPTGRMKISSRIEPAPPTEGLTFFQQQHPTFAPSNTGALPPATAGTGSNSGPGSASDPVGDVAFMEEILRSISSRHGEPALRAKFRDYIVKFTRLAAAFEEAVYGASALHIGANEPEDSSVGVSGHGYVWSDETIRARELAANVWRIEGWRMTRSYYALIQDLAALWGRKPIRSIDVDHQIDRLRLMKLSHEESGAIYKSLNQVVSGHDEICQLLTATPESHAGLFYISLGLWHPDQSVRTACRELLEKIKNHVAGRHFWNGLGKFAQKGFARVGKEVGISERDASPGSGGFANGVGIGIAGVMMGDG